MIYYLLFSWGCGSVGRALASHVRGQGFESPHLHHNVIIRTADVRGNGKAPQRINLCGFLRFVTK